MRMKTMLAAGALAALSLTFTMAAVPALAEEEGAACTTAPTEQWIGEEAAKAKATALGYEVRRVKVENDCYEIYAIDTNKAKAEIYLDPVTGAVVERKDED